MSKALTGSQIELLTCSYFFKERDSGSFVSQDSRKIDEKKNNQLFSKSLKSCIEKMTTETYGELDIDELEIDRQVTVHFTTEEIHKTLFKVTPNK